MSRSEIISAVKSGTLGVDEAVGLLESLQPRGNGRLSCKVSVKGALSVYGLQRMPVTLYAEQWERLAEFIPQIKSFTTANAATLSRKG